MRELRGSAHAARLRAALPYVVIVAGVAMLAWPIGSAWWEAREASRNISAITSVYDVMNDPERAELYEDALRYNELLAQQRMGKPVASVPVKSESGASSSGAAVASSAASGGGDPADSAPGGADGSGAPGTPDAASAESIAPYERQLSFRGSEMIAYISIPKCSIRLPIFHGTEDKELAAGVGHLMGTSLPVGGVSSHCVLTAHTGYPGKRMFDDIGLLEPDDRFVVWVLGQPLAYEVTGSEVVLPDQTESLAIRAGEDLMTLVTCTPYGVNSHRLLVHAQRCEYIDGEEGQAAAAVYVNNRTAPLLAALGILAVLAIALTIRRVAKGS